MPRGNDQKIFWPIRPGEEDADEASMEDYIAFLKKGKENKGAKFYVKRNVKSDKGIAGHYIVLLEKVEEENEAEVRGFKKHV